MLTRHGFTLVETIVALVLLQIAMLALAATAGMASRDLADAVMRRRARALAASRVEVLRSTACSAANSGSRVLEAGMVEHWRTDVIGAARSLTDSISLKLPRGVRGAAVTKAWVLCDP